MKKPNQKLNRWRNNQQEIKRSKEHRAAIKRRVYKKQTTQVDIEYNKILGARRRIIRTIYGRKKYEGPTCNVKINNSFGIEDSDNFSDFLDAAERIIDFDGGKLAIDLKDCTRVWPSSVTLLCSLSKWVELKAHNRTRSLISSTTPKIESVEEYLNRCGFYTYVGRQGNPQSQSLSNPDTVKIEREKSRKSVVSRSIELEEFVQKHCKMSVDDFEKFKCTVLPEIISNITDHGRRYNDEGWWLMAQHHPKHGFVSMCLADNGIGFGHSIRTGGQASYLRSRLGRKLRDDGECIKIAMKKDISGLPSASPPVGFRGFKKHQKGQRRGNGLDRLTLLCKDLNIRVTILSHNGYLVIDENGEQVKDGTRKSKIFAGTLYHLQIKT